MQQFVELGLNSEILKAIEEMGFEKPTLIQEKTIPFLLESSDDIIALAQTGTGKTAAFGLPIIQQIDVTRCDAQALILCPTRELCLQITRDFTNFSKFLKKINVVALYGGADITKQMDALKRCPHIIIATPGRALDLIERGRLKIENIGWLVLDEADEMLSMGFKDDLDAILRNTPKEKQTLLFSATMPKEIVSIAERYMHNPFEISAGKKNIGAENIAHHFYLINPKDRYLVIKRIADLHPDIYGIVFCRTRNETKEVADKLMADGYNADALHGDLSQGQRDVVMNRFRSKHLQMLVATDVAARGLDVNDLSHVINYNLPEDPEIYIHRSGRTGRAGKSGTSITIITPREKNRLGDIEKKIGKKFEQKKVPTGKDICEKQFFNFIDKVMTVNVDESQIEQYLPEIYEKLKDFDREELIKHFVSVEFNHFLSYYKDAEELNVRFDKPDRKSKRDRHLSYSRFFLNLGKKENISKRDVIFLINDSMPDKSIDIGDIEILNNFSFFEIDSNYEKDILKAFKNLKYQGKKVNIELAKLKK